MSSLGSEMVLSSLGSLETDFEDLAGFEGLSLSEPAASGWSWWASFSRISMNSSISLRVQPMAAATVMYGR